MLPDCQTFNVFTRVEPNQTVDTSDEDTHGFQSSFLIFTLPSVCSHWASALCKGSRPQEESRQGLNFLELSKQADNKQMIVQ